MANLTHDTSAWTASTTQDTQSKTYTFSTADTYVDKDIKLTVGIQDGSGSISGGTLTHGDITTTDTTYLTTDSSSGVGPIVFSNKASRSSISVPITTSGWIDNGDISEVSATGDDTKTLTEYVKKGSASIDSGQSITVTGNISIDSTDKGKIVANLNNTGKTITGTATAGWVTSVSSASVSASGTASAQASDLDSNLKAGNIIDGVTIFGIKGTGENEADVQFTSAAITGTTYTDISSSAPVLISNDYLYISKGAIKTPSKISLAKLVPDKASLSATDGSSYIRSGSSAYDNNGALISGSMPNAVITSGTASLNSSSVGSLDSKKGTYPLTVKVNVGAPSIGTAGYISSTEGTKNANDSQSITVDLTKGGCTINGGGLTAGNGSSSIDVNKYWNGTSYDTSDKLTLSTTKASGYYEIGTTGKGTVKRAAITDLHTAGWIEGDSSARTISDETSLDSNSGTSTYYVKKSTLGKSTVTPSSSTQTVTVYAGYYPSDRTITVNAVDPTSSSQVAQGTLSTSDSAISTLTVTKGDATLDTSKWIYSVPLTLNASGTAYAKVSTKGYVDSNDDTSNTISKEDKTNSFTLPAYSGSYTIS